ncbi:MAG: hypothetical protein AAFO91_10915 [Bacteroidota bacterium]
MKSARACLECEVELSGRTDKKFCSDICRSAYHNRINAENTAFIRSINKILRDNRNILARLNPSGKARVRRERILDHGFKFRYFTNQYTTRGGKLYHFCYDQGYLVEDGEWVTLVVRQEYVE